MRFKHLVVGFNLIASISSAFYSCNATTAPAPAQDNSSAIQSVQNPVLPTEPQAMRFVLKHDNDQCTFDWMMNDPWGQWSKFEPPTRPFEIRKVSIKGYRSSNIQPPDKKYTITIWDKNFEKQLFTRDYDYKNFPTGIKQFNIVDHIIDPPLVVNDEFIVDFISRSEWNDQSPASKDSRIYLCVDSTVGSREYIGTSFMGQDYEGAFQKQIGMEPRFSKACWVIRVEGSDNPTATIEAPPPAASLAPAELSGTWVPSPLRYDYLNSEENPYSQVAVWHPYMTLSYANWALNGTLIKTPQIILPRKEGKVHLYKDTNGQIKFKQMGTTTYTTKPDDVAMLKNPGWGLATQFTPSATPYRINNISLCGVAYHDGLLSEYANYHVLIKILDKDGNELWSKLYLWEDFRNKSTSVTEGGPGAQWKDIPVPGITVTGDYYVDIIADSMSYPTSFQMAGGGYHYFALAYEQGANCSNSHSFVSENGKRSDPVGLYDNMGNKRCFNLCIRVDGSYLEKK